ncbi:MAG: hypothetical protein R3A80_10650 [Bdellovibrionota bacterium]
MNQVMKALLFLSILSFARAESDSETIQNCLNAWGNHPFAKDKRIADKVLSPSVKVLGIGGRNIDDSKKTSKPSLVLVKPSVSVLSKSVFRLANPNGWYCLKGTVAVLGKTEFELDCHAKMASNNGDVAVLGANDNQEGGVAVLGSIRLKSIGNCSK